VRRTMLATTIMLVAVLVAACSGASQGASDSPAAATTLPKGSQPVKLDPGQFTTQIDNPYWPMKPGSRWLYREADGKGEVQRVEVVVTDQTKTIMGIEARVVHDKVTTSDGALVEDTLDWYAQDAKGNIWYLGEDTKEYENGKVTSTEGTWQAGVDGAQPGILLPATPKPGLAYRQEYYKGQAEDGAQVLSLGRKATVPSGVFDNLVITKEFTPLEPDVVEHKFYAPGVGQVLAITVSGGSSREELIRFEHAP
jgi:hypothetical protein